MPAWYKTLMGASSSSSSGSSSRRHGHRSSASTSSVDPDASLTSASSSGTPSRQGSSSTSASPVQARELASQDPSRSSTLSNDPTDEEAQKNMNTALGSPPSGIPRRTSVTAPPPNASAATSSTARSDPPTQAIPISSSTSQDAGEDDVSPRPMPASSQQYGTSPSHARHRSPSAAAAPAVSAPSTASSPIDATATSSTSSASAQEELAKQSEGLTAVPMTASASNGSTHARSSSPPRRSSTTSSAASTSSRPVDPQIPTTHTILANPPSTTGFAAGGLLSAASSLAIGSALGSSVDNRSNQGSVDNRSNAKGAKEGSNGNAQTFDIDDMISRLLDAGYTGKVSKSVCLKNPEINAICQAAREVFLSQPTLIELSPPVKIVGDVHGQYSDLIRLFEMCGFPPSSNYLFLGDYVDRGKQSLETILLLLCYKIKYPENFFLLRGNHECANVTRVYGFYDECKRRCNIKVWKTFIDVFNCLPIAAVVASKIFCVHGGLSPSLGAMDDIRKIRRPADVPDYGLLNDLLWSDPSDTALDWEDNERGVSYCFGKAVIQQFLANYDFDLICRAHMVVEDGYEFWNERTLVTIFSAPNYCGEFDNFGAVMSVSEDLLCAFELLKPLDGPALKKEMAKNRRRNSSGISIT
ncbi:uncharacterized protein L969DRAFT_86814 [Mixia osmundae IAM 14324]|uniref:Serine/threonine-protein phosphatase n=1 Tax=Mixia osmundae (strain CBS 9802 / IAM 14324 / JCM 22182 / KY 12970) TaxID=764103 RepID=G7E8T5_MIXOS|nr:uncharacterized protein L969DRAFT_86814 [Mixia osmundae IAM 14324]KEI40188.1 hypothetical protein L969DRAFT_86814 [Mixia osmundae IAM 14324]GAA99553.1 hypothetical protein E5Q_06254 [Mixia osmundae IAM 14324]